MSKGRDGGVFLSYQLKCHLTHCCQIQTVSNWLSMSSIFAQYHIGPCLMTVLCDAEARESEHRQGCLLMLPSACLARESCHFVLLPLDKHMLTSIQLGIAPFSRRVPFRSSGYGMNDDVPESCSPLLRPSGPVIRVLQLRISVRIDS